MASPPFTLWPLAFSTFFYVGTICVAIWTLYLYVVVLSQGSQRGVLRLNKLERRFADEAAVSTPASHRAWVRFRGKHLAAAEGVHRAQRLLFRPALWSSIVILVDMWCLAGLVVAASWFGNAPSSWDWVAFTLAFLSPVPWLSTMLLQRVFWHWRARSEWEVVLLGEQLKTDAEADVDQDFIGRRTERILAAVGRRFPRARSHVEDTTGRLWAAKARMAVTMRADLVTTDFTERREWTGWVATWLDKVSESFEVRLESIPAEAAPPVQLAFRDPDIPGLGAIVGICCFFGGVGLLLAASYSGFNLSTVWDALDSAVGQLTTFVGLVGAVLGIVSYRRGRSVGGS